MQVFSVLFLPDGKKTNLSIDENIYHAALKAGIALNSSCGGNGVCKRCKVIIKKGRVRTLDIVGPNDDKNTGYVLACRVYPESDLVIEIPEESRLKEHQIALESILDDDEKGQAGTEIKADVFLEHANWYKEKQCEPLYKKLQLKIPEPTLSDPEDDLGRLTRCIRREAGIFHLRPNPDILRSLPKVLRNAGWKVSVSLAEGRGHQTVEIAEIEPGNDFKKYYGLAVDIGTTTVVAHLIDLENGRTVGIKGSYNRQAAFGSDIITRIIYANEYQDGLKKLQKAVVDTINGLIEELARDEKIEPADIKTVVCAGNTTMIHLFLDLDPANIRLEPYVPVANDIPALRAVQVGLKVHPGAWVQCIPGVAGYVGGDIVAGVLVAGITLSNKLTLFIDIGTNGEMVLGNKEWMVACACSAGPAFEGCGLRHGMRAMRGAIEHLKISPGGSTVKYVTVDNVPPAGICGSGLIDSIAWLYKSGVIDRSGNFNCGRNVSRIRDSEEGKEFVLAWPEETERRSSITISEPEVKSLIRSKAAVYAGIRTMLQMVGLPFDAIERVVIAGGFGRYINIRNAVSIGLLPDIPVEKYTYVGNSSIKGAKMFLLSRHARESVEEIKGKMTYLELSTGNKFMEEFISALFIPHTDLSLFPSLQKEV